MLKIFKITGWAKAIALALFLIIGRENACADQVLNTDRLMIFNNWVGNNQDYGNPQTEAWTHTGNIYPGIGIAINKRKYLLTGSNHVHQSGWVATNVAVGSSAYLDYAQYVKPQVFSNGEVNYAANFFNLAGSSLLISPYYKDGIGTLYFDAINALPTISGTIGIEIATNMVARNNINVQKDLQAVEDSTWCYNWFSYKDINLSETAGGAVTRVMVKETLDIFTPVKFRLVRRNTVSQSQKFYDQNFLTVDNIQVSYPTKGVKIDSSSISKTRGTALSATVSIKVSNVGEVAEGASKYCYSDNTSRSVIVHYSNDGGSTWNESAMIYKAGESELGNNEEYSCDIALVEGQEKLHYYCTVEAVGNRYFPLDFALSSRTFWPDDGGEPGQSAQTATQIKDVSAWSVPVVVTSLGQDRILLFNNWTNGVDYGDYYGGNVTHIGPIPNNSRLVNTTARARKYLLPGSNHFYNSGWQVLSAAVGSSSYLVDKYGEEELPNYIGPLSYYDLGLTEGNVKTNWHANLWNTLDAMIISPSYSDGVGTIYFDAVNVHLPDEIAVDICTNMISVIGGATHYGDFAAEEYNDGFSDWKFNWQTVLVKKLEKDFAAVRGNDDFYRIKIPVNYTAGIKVRIRRNTISQNTVYSNAGYLDDAFLAIDNIQISPPAADVIVGVEEVPFNPAYPAVNDNIGVRCRVSSKAGTPATDYNTRAVEVWWRWRYGEQSSTDWAPTSMEYVPNTKEDDGAGNGELYEAKLPKQDKVGDIEYYFSCSFIGEYYQPFDYALFGYKNWDNIDNSENKSPRSCGTEGDPFSARLRRYKSNLGAMYLATDLQNEPIEMELIGDDIWRGMVPVYKWHKTAEDFTAYFIGTNTYHQGEDGDGKITYSIDTAPRFWNESGSKAEVPTGGICVEQSEEPYDDIMKFMMPKSGYVSFTIDLKDGSYKTRRAEYQDFNEWQAWDAFFASTFHNRDAQSYKDDIDGNGEEGNTGWDATLADTQDEYFRVATSNLWKDALFKDYIVTDRETFELASACYVGELSQVNATNSAFGADSSQNKYFPNVAARLIGVNQLAVNTENLVSLGSVSTLAGTVLDGLQSFSFKARVNEMRNLDSLAYYNLDDYNLQETNYTISVEAKILDESPEEHSISAIAYYKRNSFYELRLTQCAPKGMMSPRQGGVDAVKPYYRLDIYRWNNGKATLLKSDTSDNAEFSKAKISDVALVFTFTVGKIKNEDKIKLVGEVKIGSSDGTKTAKIDTTDESSNRLTKGDAGFWSANCQASVTKYSHSVTTDDATTSTPLALDSQNWEYDSNYFFAINSNEFTTRKPRNAIAVYIQDADVEHKADPAARSWTLYKEYEISTYNYMPYKLDFNSWEAKHVKIQNLGCDDVAIDEINLNGYHAKNIGGNVYDWEATEVWVDSLTDGHKKVLTLDLSRADNSAYGYVRAGERQAVRAPYMDWGRGSLAFDYKVVDSPVLLALQISDDEYGPWETLSYHPLTDISQTNKWNHFYEYVGNTNSGCMRIVNLQTNDYIDADGNVWDFTGGTIQLDNFIAWDNPVPTNSVAWKTYNGRITQCNNPAILTLDGSKVLVLNNSVNNDVYDGYAPMNLSKPYLKTPAISTGIGEIRLEARLFDDSAESATLKVYGLVGDEWTVDGANWQRISMLDVTNIASQFYTVFTHDGQRIPGVDPEYYKAIKFESEYDGSQPRICIENVSITEPLYPGFEINNVKLLYHTNKGEYGYRDQPLVTDLVGVEAKLTNLRLNPQDIKVYLSYYVGTNVWGVQNIWGPKNLWKPTQPNTVQMQLYGDPADRIYRTPFDNDIPFQEENEVVQYVVWATYTSEEGGTVYTAMQGEKTFETPDWYYPTDLNKMFGAWSAYYITYRIPRGAVFFNELNFHERPSLTSNSEFGIYYNSFIELAIPADTDMTGWRVELIDADLKQQATVRLNTADSGKSEVTNGYAFLVIADTEDEQKLYTGGVLPNVDIYKPGLNESFIYARDPGGLRLKRPLGMYEQAITFDRYGDIENSIIDAATGEPFTYVGIDGQTASLSVTNQTGQSLGDWSTISWYENTYLSEQNTVVGENVKVWTPGEPNMFQIMPMAPEIYAGLSNIVVMAYISPSTKGLQNGVNTRLAFKMAVTDTTNIVYDSHNWYHVTSVKIVDEKTGEVTECVGNDEIFRVNNSTNYTLTLQNLPHSVSIYATISADSRYDDPSLPYTVREWLMRYPESEVSKHTSWLVPWNWKPSSMSTFGYAPDETRELSFLEMYWFNCEPIRSNYLYHDVVRFEPASVDPSKPNETNVYLTVKMRLEYATDDGTGIVTNRLTSLRGSTVNVDIPAFKVKACNYSDSVTKWYTISQYTFDDASFDEDYSCRIKLNVHYPFFDGKTTLSDSDGWWFRYRIEYEDGAFSRPSLQNTPKN